VDGLILLKHDLTLVGFGVEITSKTEPKHVSSGENSAGTKGRPIDLNHYGTRHRSMMRYCSADHDSLGFVVSQDGDVRAITDVGGTIVMWDEVRLHSITNARNSGTRS
jgi:hypothetical protein